MKSVITISLLIICMGAKAQDPPVKANVILVHGVCFKEVVNKLLDSGYLINKMDSNFNLIETEPYHPHYRSGLIHRMIVRVRVKDSTAQFTSTYGLGDYGTISDRVANFKMWRNNNKTPWYALNSFALSFNKPVEYLVQ